MQHLPQQQAFSHNQRIQKILPMQESVCIENAINDNVLSDIRKFCIDFLKIESFDVFQDTKTPRWFREGLVHQTEFVKQLSEEIIKPMLGLNDILIGDTAFCINWPPHDLHIDCRDFRVDVDGKAGIIGTKSVVVPVELDNIEYTTFYTGNQYFYGPTTRMRNGCEKLDENNETIEQQKSDGVYFSYDYAKDGVLNLDYDNPLTYDWWKQNIDSNDGVPYSVFEGVTIEKEHKWKPGNIIMFDSARLHWGGNLLKKGATYKMGLSLNYGHKE